MAHSIHSRILHSISWRWSDAPGGHILTPITYNRPPNTMFKAIGNLIHKTPWWALILGGISTLTLLVLFTLPVQVIRLVDSGATPAERHAIQREVGLAVGSKALKPGPRRGQHHSGPHRP